MCLIQRAKFFPMPPLWVESWFQCGAVRVSQQLIGPLNEHNFSRASPNCKVPQQVHMNAFAASLHDLFICHHKKGDGDVGILNVSSSKWLILSSSSASLLCFFTEAFFGGSQLPDSEQSLSWAISHGRDHPKLGREGNWFQSVILRMFHLQNLHT